MKNFQRLLFLLLLISNICFAQDISKLPSVGEILDADGSVRLNKDGGYDVSGYQIQIDNDGQPRLSPTENAQTMSATNTWSGVGSGTGGLVTSFAVYDGSLIVGGDFTSPGRRIASWNGSSWSKLGTATDKDGTNNTVNALAVYNGELYVGGTFTYVDWSGTASTSISANRIAKWNGVSWSSVGTGSANGVNNEVRALAVYNGNLYVAGNFTQAGGASANRIARWNGTSWSAVGSGTDGQINAMAVYNNELYVGGNFNNAGGNPSLNIARYNGSTWNSVGTGALNGLGGPVIALAVYKGLLFVGGNFTIISVSGPTIGRIVRWDGSNWNASGISANDVVRALAVYYDDLYVGGSFTQVGSVSANRIAKWNGTSWSAVGSGITGSGFPYVAALSVFNNQLYAGGIFSTAGFTSVSNIARWTHNSPSSASYSQTITSFGNTEFTGTGLSINFSGVSGIGSCTVERFDNSPAQNIAFSSTPPTFISRYRYVITASFVFTSATLRFNRTQIPNAGITNVQTVTVYRRPTPGSGTFSSLTNNYNPLLPNEVRATTTSFSEFILGSDDANNQLPVELVEFTGRKTSEGVQLAWRTASELNNSGFEVERKSQGGNWNTLGFVRGNGTTTEAQSYSFLDRTASGKVQYRLKQIDFDGQFEYSPMVEVDAGLPKTFELSQNYPNPFNPTTVISYQLPVASNVSLKVYDVLGKEVMTLVNGRQEAGQYNASVNASALASGVYFYRLQAGNFVSTKKMMLVK